MPKVTQEFIITESEEGFSLTLHEVSFSFGVTEQTIIEIIDEGIIQAEKNESDEWCFDNEALKRIRTVLQLQRDLGVNLPGAALAIELLREIELLKAFLPDNKP